jgi:putative component of toxin-antitoxin plasmid stabilization module
LFVRRTDGSVPAADFLEGLDGRERGAFKALFKQLGDMGTITNKERLLQIQTSDHVWEFKVHTGKGWRMWGKYGTRGMYVTHGARKPKDNKLKRETDLAQIIYEDRGDAQ